MNEADKSRMLDLEDQVEKHLLGIVHYGNLIEREKAKIAMKFDSIEHYDKSGQRLNNRPHLRDDQIPYLTALACHDIDVYCLQLATLHQMVAECRQEMRYLRAGRPVPDGGISFDISDNVYQGRLS